MNQQIVDSLRLHIRAGKTKAEAVRQIVSEYPDLDRKTALPAFSEGLQMSDAAANTYYYKYRVKSLLTVEPKIQATSTPEIATSALRQSLEDTATEAAIWYTERTQPIERDVFLSKSGLGDRGKGSVYSYHSEECALYVGITGYRVKSRLTTPTSPHKEKEWWPVWEHMRFLPLSNRSERETLEHLLILGLMPEYNRKPAYMDFEAFLGQY